MTKTTRLLTASALSVVWLLSGYSAASSGLAKLDRVLKDTVAQAATDPVRVIIQLAPGGRADVDRELRVRGDRLIADLSIIQGVTAEVQPRHLVALAALPGVRGISSDGPVHAAAVKKLTPRSTRSSPTLDATQSATQDTSAPPLKLRPGVQFSDAHR